MNISRLAERQIGPRGEERIGGVPTCKVVHFFEVGQMSKHGLLMSATIPAKGS